MRPIVVAGLIGLRLLAVGALLLGLFDPPMGRRNADLRPIVLLDASLSMAGHGGTWNGALDSARAAAAGGVVRRFGDHLEPFDTTPPRDGSSLLQPALAAAAGRGGPIIIVTDGEIADAAAIPPDLRRRARVIVLPRAPFADRFVASVDGPRRVQMRDTVRLRVSYGAAGSRDARGGRGSLVVEAGGRRMAVLPVALPDSGVLTAEITFAAARLQRGMNAITVRLAEAADPEPRDDGRSFVIDVGPEAAAVVFAAPSGPDARFFARALADVARVPVRVFTQAEAGRWRDARTLAPVAAAEVTRAATGARLVALIGDSSSLRASPRSGGVVRWSPEAGTSGDWYVDPPPPSPLAAALAGIAWDSLPPLTVVGDPASEDGVTVLSARLARRGGARPILRLTERGDMRRVDLLAGGLWRWALRGGASEQAYRTFVAALADWLLQERGAGNTARAVPDRLEAANGRPVVWRWVGTGQPRSLGITLTSDWGSHTDSLRFDIGGRAELRLPPGVYRYSLSGEAAAGMIVVEEYSDEWRPAARTLTAQRGEPGAGVVGGSWRDRWWLFGLAVAALAGEWAWRRREGLA